MSGYMWRAEQLDEYARRDDYRLDLVGWEALLTALDGVLPPRPQPLTVRSAGGHAVVLKSLIRNILDDRFENIWEAGSGYR